MDDMRRTVQLSKRQSCRKLRYPLHTVDLVTLSLPVLYYLAFIAVIVVRTSFYRLKTWTRVALIVYVDAKLTGQIYFDVAQKLKQ